MAFANTDGRKIYYEAHGDGSPFVLIHHGFAGTGMWKDIYPGLVEKGHRVIMYDRRGYGQSERGTDFEEFYASDRYLAESVEDLSALRKALDIDSFNIIGQCEGGAVGLEYASKHPEQVNSIVISSTLCYSEIPMAEFNRLKFPGSFQNMDPEFKEMVINWHGQEHAEKFYDSAIKGGGAYGRGMFDLRGLLPTVKCPALVIYPDRSSLFDVDQGLAFYRGLPKGELAVLPGCGHNTYKHRPEEYVRHVLSFFKRHNF